MIRSYTDEELRELGRLPKKVTNPGARWSEKPKAHPVHKQRIFRATGTGRDDRELQFLIFQRMSLRDDLSYSCGIA